MRDPRYHEYEVTMTMCEGTPDEVYAARIFNAPDDVSAVAFAIKMPHLSGWGPGNVTITVGRHWPMIVEHIDDQVHVCAAECEVRFVDRWIVDPLYVAQQIDAEILRDAQYVIDVNKRERS